MKIESPPKKQIWLSFDDRTGHSLLTEDKWLIQIGKCLNDRIISGWQFLLQQKFSHCGGLYPAVLAYHGKYKSDTKKSGIVQVLNSEGKHWVAISTIGCSSSVVNWLDSLHGIPSMHHEKVIALFCPICVYWPIRVWDVPYAYGTSHTRMGYPVRVWANMMSHTRMGVPYEYACIIAS